MTAVPIQNPILPAIADAPVPTTPINKKRQLDAYPTDEPAAGSPPAKRKKLEATPAKATPTIKRQQSLLGWAKPTKDVTSDVPEPESSTSVVLKRDVTLETVFRGLDDETKALLKLESDTMEIGWLKVLGPELRKGYFIELKKFLQKERDGGKQVFPPENQIYSWSVFTPLSNVKVVILGQDPYHDRGQAHGLCFSVPKGVRSPPSLVNIYKAMKNDIPGFTEPGHGYLEAWAKEGVLMLNTSLTVRAHDAASHAGKGWEKFTDAIINYLNEKKSGLVFMLWGSHAQKKGAKINKKNHLILKAVHPSPLSAHKGFMDCKHWSQANAYLEEKGKTPVNWKSLV